MSNEPLFYCTLLATILFGCSPGIDYPEKPLYRFCDNLDKAEITIGHGKDSAGEDRTSAGEGRGFKTDVRNAILCPVPSELIFNLTIPRNAVLTFAIGLRPEAGIEAGKAVSFKIIVEPRGSAPAELFSKAIQTDAEGGWLDEKLDISRFMNREAKIIFRTEFQPAQSGAGNTHGAIAMWGNPVLYSPSAELHGLNVILVSIDTLRPDHLKCYGYEKDTSPNIDRLASEGVLFKNAVAQSTWTLPSHMSMLTSLYPSQHGVITLSNTLSPDIQTLAGLLRNNNYNTAAFTGGGYISSQFGFYRGFNSYFQPAGKPAVWDKASLEKALSLHDKNAATYKIDRGYDASASFDKAIDWIKRNHDRKFFVFLHTYETHPPYVANEFTDEFSPDYNGPIGKVLSEDALDKLRGKFEIPGYKAYMEGVGKDDFRYLVAMYDGHIKRMDTYMGKLLNGLNNLKIDDNTLVIFTSDHGDEFMEHGNLIQHGNTLYDEQIRVPLIMKCLAEFGDGKRITQQVSLNDIVPTVLDFTGTVIPPGLAGRSLKNCLEGAVPQPGQVISETQRGKSVSLRSQEYKYIYSPIFDRHELYNLAEDNGESRNIAQTKGDIAEAYKNSILQYMDTYFDGYFVLCCSGDAPLKFNIRASSHGRFTEAVSTHKKINHEFLATTPVKSVSFDETVGANGKALVYLKAYPSDASIILNVSIDDLQATESVYLGKNKGPAAVLPIELDPGKESIAGRPEIEEGEAGCFIWRNRDGQAVSADKTRQDISKIDDNLREQLKALGYLN